MAPKTARDSLRRHLRAATAEAHDRLDFAMRNASGWAVRDDYIRFLALQLSARRPVESWLAQRAPAHLLPPPQSPLIERDLIAMGEHCCSTLAAIPFQPPAPSDASVLGVAWVLAGSALGNRSILKEVNAQGPDWSTAFLADPSMLEFWQRLRVRMERPARDEEASAASAAAEGVFSHFIRCAGLDPVSTECEPSSEPTSPHQHAPASA